MAIAGLGTLCLAAGCGGDSVKDLRCGDIVKNDKKLNEVAAALEKAKVPGVDRRFRDATVTMVFVYCQGAPKDAKAYAGVVGTLGRRGPKLTPEQKALVAYLNGYIDCADKAHTDLGGGRIIEALRKRAWSAAGRIASRQHVAISFYADCLEKLVPRSDPELRQIAQNNAHTVRKLASAFALYRKGIAARSVAVLGQGDRVFHQAQSAAGVSAKELGRLIRTNARALAGRVDFGRLRALQLQAAGAA